MVTYTVVYLWGDSLFMMCRFAQVVESLKAGKDKKRVADEYLACVEFTRQKAAQRAQQEDK